MSTRRSAWLIFSICALIALAIAIDPDGGLLSDLFTTKTPESLPAPPSPSPMPTSETPPSPTSTPTPEVPPSATPTPAPTASPVPSPVAQMPTPGPVSDHQLTRESALCETEGYGPCYTAGVLALYHGSVNEAARLFRKACDKEKPLEDACIDAGLLLAPADIDALKRKCSAANVKACILSSTALRKSNESESNRLMRSACDYGSYTGCVWLGRFLSPSNQAELDVACRANERKACLQLSGVHAEQNLIALRQACLANDVRACFLWGRGSRVSDVSLMQENCKNGQPSFCLRLAGFLDGGGSPDDSPPLLKRACSLGSTSTCELIKILE